MAREKQVTREVSRRPRHTRRKLHSPPTGNDRRGFHDVYCGVRRPASQGVSVHHRAMTVPRVSRRELRTESVSWKVVRDHAMDVCQWLGNLAAVRTRAEGRQRIFPSGRRRTGVERSIGPVCAGFRARRSNLPVDRPRVYEVQRRTSENRLKGEDMEPDGWLRGRWGVPSALRPMPPAVQRRCKPMFAPGNKQKPLTCTVENLASDLPPAAGGEGVAWHGAGSEKRHPAGGWPMQEADRGERAAHEVVAWRCASCMSEQCAAG